MTKSDMRIDCLRQKGPKDISILRLGAQKPSSQCRPLFMLVNHVISHGKHLALLGIHGGLRQASSLGIRVILIFTSRSLPASEHACTFRWRCCEGLKKKGYFLFADWIFCFFVFLGEGTGEGGGGGGGSRLPGRRLPESP